MSNPVFIKDRKNIVWVYGGLYHQDCVGLTGLNGKRKFAGEV